MMGFILGGIAVCIALGVAILPAGFIATRRGGEVASRVILLTIIGMWLLAAVVPVMLAVLHLAAALLGAVILGVPLLILATLAGCIDLRSNRRGAP